MVSQKFLNGRKFFRKDGGHDQNNHKDNLLGMMDMITEDMRDIS